ncbi:MAG: hypothetical protein ABI663_16220 [Chryseolinea sp.]
MKLFILVILFGTSYLCQGQVNSTLASNYTSNIVDTPVFQKQKFSAYDWTRYQNHQVLE